MSQDLISESHATLTPFTRKGCGIETATKLARVLLGSYPKEPHEPEIYTRAVVSVLAEQPPDIARQAVDRVTRELRFLPTRADICSAIKKIKTEIQQRESVNAQESERRSRHSRWEMEEQERAADRQAMRDCLGEAYDAWNAIPWQRRYKGSPEDFRAGWTAAEDKAAFCESWGS